ncbi:hypothetical protein D3C73_889600 [compost metagenome]
MLVALAIILLGLGSGIFIRVVAAAYDWNVIFGALDYFPCLDIKSSYKKNEK